MIDQTEVTIRLPKQLTRSNGGNMAKSKMRFNTPRIWTAHEERVMREDDCGGWVRLHDYNELLYAYRGALAQLDRAAKRIAGMKQTTSNALAQADAACGVSPGAEC